MAPISNKSLGMHAFPKEQGDAHQGSGAWGYMMRDGRTLAWGTTKAPHSAPFGVLHLGSRTASYAEEEQEQKWQGR